MTRSEWPMRPSVRFERWRGEFDEYRAQHAPAGRHFQDSTAYRQQLYYTHGGLDEAVTLGDLDWTAQVEGRIAKSQRVVWDVHAREVMVAAGEGGLEATAEALRESEEWVLRLRRDGQPVDVSSDAARWASGVLGVCPPNPLIRSEEAWGLWKSVAGARQICIALRDQLLLELEDEGVARTRMARALGWSYGRLRRHLSKLEEHRLTLGLRAQAGDVTGVLSLQASRTHS